MCYKPGISLPFSDVVYSRIVLSVSDVLQSRNLIVIVQAVQAQAPAIVCVACLELHCRFLTLLSGVDGDSQKCMFAAGATCFVVDGMFASLQYRHVRLFVCNNSLDSLYMQQLYTLGSRGPMGLRVYVPQRWAP